MDTKTVRETVIEQLEKATRGLDLLVALAGFAGETDEQASEAKRLVRLAIEEVGEKAEPLPPLDQAIADAIKEHRSLWLSVWRKSGQTETVRFEPYRIEQDPRRGKVLVCYHVEHQHPERLAFSDIRWMSGWGALFTPREVQ